jgi:hypothetical protein
MRISELVNKKFLYRFKAHRPATMPCCAFSALNQTVLLVHLMQQYLIYVFAIKIKMIRYILQLCCLLLSQMC